MFLGIRKKKRWRVLMPLCCLLLAAGCKASEPPAAAPAEVVFSVIGEEKVTLTRSLPGRVSALVTAEVRPQVDGIIIERLFEEGAEVAKGQVLYRIDPALYKAAHATAKAGLAEAQASVTAIAMQEKRQSFLFTERAVSRQDLDNTISQHGQARARVAKAEAELETAAINLAYTEIKAPVAGRIGASSVTVGALVTANQPSALAVIHQTDRVYIDITQSSSDTLRLRRAIAQGRIVVNGTAAKVRLTLEDGSPYTAIAQNPVDAKAEWIQGDLLFSEISVGKDTGSLKLRAVFSNPDKLLLPGMYVRAIIEEGTVENAVLIPQGAALANNTGGHSVYILRDDGAGENLFRVERRDVRLEGAFGNRWMVGSGLNRGDMLIVEGLQKVASGERVKAIAASGDSTRAISMTSGTKVK